MHAAFDEGNEETKKKINKMKMHKHNGNSPSSYSPSVYRIITWPRLKTLCMCMH